MDLLLELLVILDEHRMPSGSWNFATVPQARQPGNMRGPNLLKTPYGVEATGPSPHYDVVDRVYLRLSRGDTRCNERRDEHFAKLGQLLL